MWQNFTPLDWLPWLYLIHPDNRSVIWELLHVACTEVISLKIERLGEHSPLRCASTTSQRSSLKNQVKHICRSLPREKRREAHLSCNWWLPALGAKSFSHWYICTLLQICQQYIFNKISIHLQIWIQVFVHTHKCDYAHMDWDTVTQLSTHSCK